MVAPTQGFQPAIISGMTLYPDDPLKFDFIVDIGDNKLQGEALAQESKKLINYFLATLTVPEDEMWVNLSPYEKDRIIAEGLSFTEMGRDMLAQDYLLKQLAASLMYPEDELGKEFWDRVYQKAYQQYGTTEIPMNTFNKVWIVPDRAAVYVHGASVFVSESHLKVMLEEDYLALESNAGSTKHGLGNVTKDDLDVISGVSAQIVREVLIPEIEKEVNEGKNFANLRQIYNSMILATWYKKNLKESLLDKVYVNQNKVQGIDIEDKEIKAKIYDRYLEAFKKGVYNYIKEDYDPASKGMIPRKYFSGGIKNVKDVSEQRGGVPEDLLRKTQRPHVLVSMEGDLVAGGDGASSPIIDKGKEIYSKLSTQAKVAAGAAVLGLSLAGGYYYVAQGDVRDWVQSKSKADLVSIQEASQNSDSSTLDQIGNKARSRHTRILRAIKAALDSGLKRVDNQTQDDIGLAEKYSIFDLFTATFADLEENKISKTPERRIGGITPKEWQESIPSLNKEAESSRHEVKLAMALRSLEAELIKEKAGVEQMQVNIDKFSNVAPAFFKGEMGDDIRSVRRSFDEFVSTEQKPEEALLKEANEKMLKRVSDKLYGQSTEFKSHRDRHDSLKMLLDKTLSPAAATAHKIVEDIDAMIASKTAAATNLILAHANESVTVTYSETSYDSKGNGRTVTRTRIEDHSLPFKVMAATAAANASSYAQSANKEMQNLQKLLYGINQDKTYVAEQLPPYFQDVLRNAAVDDSAFDSVLNIFAPAMVSLFVNLASTDGTHARDKIVPLSKGVDQLVAEVSGRFEKEKDWVGGKIKEDLDAQIAEVKSATSSPVAQSPEYGGIDLNPGNLDLEQQGMGIQFSIPEEYQNIDPSSIGGIAPVIINIFPVPNLMLLLGSALPEAAKKS